MDKSQPLKLHLTSQYWFTLKWLGSLSPSEATSVTALERVGGWIPLKHKQSQKNFLNSLVAVFSFIICMRHHYVTALKSYLLLNNEHAFSSTKNISLSWKRSIRCCYTRNKILTLDKISQKRTAEQTHSAFSWIQYSRIHWFITHQWYESLECWLFF